jgi:branched-chain amino acid transport system permease protein
VYGPGQGKAMGAGGGRFGAVWRRAAGLFAAVPILGWLLGAAVAVALEQGFGRELAWAIGLPKEPVLFGIVLILKKPELIPAAFFYVALIYLLPIGLVARLAAPAANAAARALYRTPLIVQAGVHLAILYLVLHYWAELSDYRDLTARLTLIAVIVTLSLNIINGYMGEFSCSHPGFMSLGAYMGSVFSVSLFADDKLFGAALLPPELAGPLFPVGLFMGGMAAAVGAVAIAIPSFRTRGDYLAIISLAFMFIVKSFIENLEVVGGPRGLMGHPDVATLPVVFLVCVFAVWTINNFVTSIYGKATNAVRDNEMAAEAMTVNTRRTKMTAFMFAAFWAGVAGALLAHVLRYVNPAIFGLQKLAEVLAMVYFGGLNSVAGSVVGAVSIQLLGEMLRPLEIFKWIIIPLLLILVMIYRPTGLISFTELDVREALRPRDRKG